MKRRERIFILSAGLLFLVAFVVLSSIVEVAKGVGDAPIFLNSGYVALKVSGIVLFVYSFLYYAFTFVFPRPHDELKKLKIGKEYQSFLAVYDYGTGGIWLLLEAKSFQNAQETFPELTVFEDKPEWMEETQKKEFISNCIQNNMHWNIDQPLTGWLNELVDNRKSVD